MAIELSVAAKTIINKFFLDKIAIIGDRPRFHAQSGHILL